MLDYNKAHSLIWKPYLAIITEYHKIFDSQSIFP